MFEDLSLVHDAKYDGDFKNYYDVLLLKLFILFYVQFSSILNSESLKDMKLLHINV